MYGDPFGEFIQAARMQQFHDYFYRVCSNVNLMTLTAN